MPAWAAASIGSLIAIPEVKSVQLVMSPWFPMTELTHAPLLPPW